MIQKVAFSNGGFVLHRIQLPNARRRMSAWYDAAGQLLSAEAFDSLSRSYPVRADSAAWSQLERIGQRHA